MALYTERRWPCPSQTYPVPHERYILVWIMYTYCRVLEVVNDSMEGTRSAFFKAWFMAWLGYHNIRGFPQDSWWRTNNSNGIHKFISSKHLFTLLCVKIYSWTSSFVVQAHDNYVCTWWVCLPWISRSNEACLCNGHMATVNPLKK